MPEIQSANLGVTDVVQGSANEAAQANDALAQLDSFLTQVKSVDLTSASYTLTADPPEMKRYRKYKIMNCTGARSLTVRSIPRSFWVDTSDASNTHSTDIKLGATTLTLATGKKALFETDGTANGLELVIST